MKKWFYSLVVLGLMATFLLGGVVSVQAQNTTDGAVVSPSQFAPVENIAKPWEPLSQSTGLSFALARVFNWFFGFLAAITLVLIIYAGILYLTAGGNEEQTKTAKTILVNAVAGLIVILISLALVNWVRNIIQGKNQ